MWIRFGQINIEMEIKYDGQTNPREHIQLCTTTWKEIPQQEWVHGFIHTLETIPKNWYLETNLRHGTVNWEDMVNALILKFGFEDDFPYIDLALQTIKNMIFQNVTPLTWQQLDWTAQIKNALECYNLTTKQEEYPRNINIEKSEGYCKVDGTELEILYIMKPLKRKKVNIGLEKEPKFAII